MNLFEAIRQLGSRARFLVIGSGEEYGLVYPDELPIVETNPLRPLSPYAVSKVTQDLMGFQYWKPMRSGVTLRPAHSQPRPRRGGPSSDNAPRDAVAACAAAPPVT